ncbi:hypothetical protein Leryth_005945 [Lithospermum erythrorhizon]|nr:hypothetical protein Leryth_005945 [Lithospermum erythrorhizon]
MNFCQSVTIFVTFSHFSTIISALSNTFLVPNQFIKDGQTLVSPNQTFEVGFFSPGTSQTRYLGIWYKTTPSVIVWVANRDHPLQDSQGLLTLTNNATLLLLDNSTNVIWSSISSSFGANPELQLLDTGNLVIIDKKKSNRESYIWQSFDFPGDTRLPGMLMGENSDTNIELSLTSWKSSDDPSPGEFSYRVENYGLPHLVLSSGNSKVFRSGPWNGIRFNGLPMFPNKAFDNTVFVFDKFWLVSLSDPFNESIVSRLTLNESGSIGRFILDEKKKEWKLVYMIPNNPCDYYGQCGNNSVCNTNVSPNCQCLKGFSPKSQQEWDLLDWSSGCRRNSPLQCKNGDGFWKVLGIKLPDLLLFQLNVNMSIKDCETECLKNCSCVAYTDPFVNEGSNGCLMWYGDLVDIREFSAEKSEQNVYIRLPVSELDYAGGSSEKKKVPSKLIFIVTGFGLLASILVFAFVVHWNVKRNKTTKNKYEDDHELELPLFSSETIAAATNNFSQANILGQGGFGPVYKGKLSGGQEIAVKRLSKTSRQGVVEFKTEVNLIAKLQHRNLVRLLGSCIQGEERMLIYEFMQNKSLDRFLYDASTKTLLNWPRRFEIMMGISRGILYLHQDSRLKIIHRDLKTSNILLDNDLNPKISDFGLARIFGGEQPFEETKRVIGTFGYMAPEYAIDGRFSEKSDVFSLGVILLEIISGKENRNFSHPDHHHTLLGHAWLLWNDDRVLELVDENFKPSLVDQPQALRSIHVGLLCVQKLAEDRPTMSSVVFMLGNEGAILPRPEEPGFFMERSRIRGEASGSAFKRSKLGNREDSTTDSLMTITRLVGR